jgi:hypothetical protein
MYAGRLVFAQVIDHLPLHSLRRCVARYGGQRKLKRFSCLDQYLCMAFAQLTYRESLRDIEACLRAHHAKLYHMGIRAHVSRSTLADANERRDWRIYADFAQALIAIARRLYAEDAFGVDLAQTVYALDSTTIDLCLSVFPWARFKRTKGALKLHTLLDLRGPIPSVIHVTDGKTHDVKVLDLLLDLLVPEPGAFYIFSTHRKGSSYLSACSDGAGDGRYGTARSRQLPRASRRAGCRRFPGPGRPRVSSAPARSAIQAEQSQGLQARIRGWS